MGLPAVRLPDDFVFFTPGWSYWIENNSTRLAADHVHDVGSERLLPGRASVYSSGFRDQTKSVLPTRRNTLRSTRVPVAQGTVRWFKTQKGYGFIHPDGGGGDVFVHISAVERSGLSQLHEGQKVSFDVEKGVDGKTSAANLKVL